MSSIAKTKKFCWSPQDYTEDAQLADQWADPQEVYTFMSTWKNPFCIAVATLVFWKTLCYICKNLVKP